MIGNFNDAFISSTTDYRFHIPAGVWNIGDSAVLGVTAEMAERAHGPVVALPGRGTAFLIDSGPYLLGSNGRIYDFPSGRAAITPTLPGESTPDGVSVHALFTPTRTESSASLLRVEDEVTLFAENAAPTNTGVFTADPSGRWWERRTHHLDLPPGKYWIGDVSPNFTRNEWDEVSSSGNDITIGGERVIMIEVEPGTYHAADGNIFPLPAGKLGVMRARRTPPTGGVHTYAFYEPKRVSWSDGWTTIGLVELSLERNTTAEEVMVSAGTGNPAAGHTTKVNL